jgi:hypothetical protein
MAKKKSRSPEKKAAQKMRTAANKIKKWKEHIAKHPNDAIGNKKLEELLKKA